jgi:hypothetical protein
MKKKDAGLPAIGDFENQVLVGEFQPSLAGSFPTTSYFGLVQEGLYLYGSFHDHEGHLYIIARKILPDVTPGLNIYTTLDGGNLKRLSRRHGQRYAGLIGQEIVGNAHVIQSKSTGGLPPFTCRRRLDGLDWIEGDLLSIQARLVGGAGLQFLDIGPEGMGMYTSHIHYGEGTILNRHVRGFFGWDSWYYPPGVTWQTSQHYRELEVAWFTLGNLYEDGSMEIGQIAVGAKKWGFALIGDRNQTTILTTDTDAEIEVKESGYPSRILYKIQGEEWEWRIHPQGEIPDIRSAGFDTYMTCEGICQRVGDTRKPVVTFGWIDFFSDSLERWEKRCR